jgi:hypothetical protein
MNTFLILVLCSQINPYGDAAVAPIVVPQQDLAGQVLIPSAAGKFVTGIGGAAIAGALEANGTLAVEAVPGAGVNLDYLRTRGGLDEDYRLAQLLIARTLQRRMEAARLMAAAQGIELNNARLREYVCSRFCSAPTGIPATFPAIPPTPMFPAVDPNLGVDPSLYPAPLPYVPPMPRDDFNARYYIRHGGTVNVQVVPQIPAYRRRY